jgi:mevalonate kinase
MKYHRKANGKILLTSEYFILDGAKGIALPTKLGQTLSVNENESFQYEAYLNDGTLWFRYDPKNNENESVLLLNSALDYIAKNNENQDVKSLKFFTRIGKSINVEQIAAVEEENNCNEFGDAQAIFEIPFV